MVNIKSLHNPGLGVWILRLGLAFVFGYAGVASLQHPAEWAGYLPTFVTSTGHALQLIKVLAVYELVLALWLVVGKGLRYAAGLGALTLLGIITANPHNLVITFRDVGLAAMAAALFFLA
ncbi:MAG TPA: DoxX family membrane protein [Candidatus Saccharimonadales bacterium]|nr:DoxX family membrane protein [Candidatus Saccharimonadales bacterium]